MDNILIELHKKIESLLGACYEKNKEKFTEVERELIEMYLYEQGEYEEALTSYEACLAAHSVVLGPDESLALKEVRLAMGVE